MTEWTYARVYTVTVWQHAVYMWLMVYTYGHTWMSGSGLDDSCILWRRWDRSLTCNLSTSTRSFLWSPLRDIVQMAGQSTPPLNYKDAPQKWPAIIVFAQRCACVRNQHSYSAILRLSGITGMQEKGVYLRENWSVLQLVGNSYK